MKIRQLFFNFMLGILLFMGAGLVKVFASGDFPCYVQLVKTNCWKDFEITVQPIDVISQQKTGEPIILGKEVFEKVVPVACKPGQPISFTGAFSPPTWEGTENKHYVARHFWMPPDSLPKNADKWVISVCFAEDFTSVPLPPSATSVCECKFSELPRSQVLKFH